MDGKWKSKERQMGIRVNYENQRDDYSRNDSRDGEKGLRIMNSAQADERHLR